MDDRLHPDGTAARTKRGTTLALALVVALVVSGCTALDSGEDENAETTTVAAQETATAQGETSTTPGETTTTPQAETDGAALTTPEGTAADSTAPTDAATAVPETATTTPSAATAPPTTTPTTTTTTPAGTTQPSTPQVATAPPVAPTATELPGQSLPIQRFFAPDSPWNTLVDAERPDPRSGQMMRLARLRTAVIETPGGGFRTARREIKVGVTINVKRWTVPVFSDVGGEPTATVCRQLDCGPDAVTSVVIPPDARPQPQFDGWMTVIDTERDTALDFWRARRERDGSISYHYVKAWDLNGPGFQEPGGVSARGSGLPLFAGLITPEEIKAGRIQHALAISVPGAAKRRYVQPASRTDGTGQINSLPEGARLRLEPGGLADLTNTFVRSKAHKRVAGIIIDALERYGAIVVDRSAAPTLYAQRNADWTGILPLNLLQDIELDQFEVVELPEIQFDPPQEGEPASGITTVPPSVPSTGSGTQTAPGPPTVGDLP